LGLVNAGFTQRSRRKARKDRQGYGAMLRLLLSMTN
jgi:hypothetical protein